MDDSGRLALHFLDHSIVSSTVDTLRVLFSDLNNPVEHFGSMKGVNASSVFFPRSNSVFRSNHHSRTLFTNDLKNDENMLEEANMEDRHLEFKVSEVARTV